MRADTREKGLNALRQLIDEIDSCRYAGLYLVVTGTAAFFEGPQGVQRLPPLAQRLHTDIATEARFDNPRAVQIRLQEFDLAMPSRGSKREGSKTRGPKPKGGWGVPCSLAGLRSTDGTVPNSHSENIERSKA
jgi:P-loop Domain of unknown function (DUF2791)